MHFYSGCAATVATLYLLFAGNTVSAQNAASAKPTVSLSGAVSESGEWKAKRITSDLARDVKTVSYKLKDKKHTARCVPLWNLLQRAEFKPSAPTRKNPNLSLVVTAVGADGYAAAFSYGELSPEYGKRTVYVALDQDGKPHPGAGIELLVLTNGKSSRYVHDVRKLIVTDTTAAQ